MAHGGSQARGLIRAVAAGLHHSGNSSLSLSSFRAAPAAYGGSEARGQIRAVATSLHHSHSNTGSKLRLQPTPQLTAMLDH